jgi:hypothetical protein
VYSMYIERNCVQILFNSSTQGIHHMSSNHDRQSTGISKHPLEHGLEVPAVSPPAGERHEDYFPKESETTSKKPNVMRRIIGGTAATALLIGGGFVVKSMVGSEKAPSAENPARNPDRTVSAPATPGEATADTPTGSEIESPKGGPVALSAERYKDGASLVTAWNTQNNEWTMSNATKETKENEDLSISREKYVAQINEPVDDAYINALLVQNWQENPNLVEFVEARVRNHYNTVFINLATTDSDRPEDIEPYEAGRKVISSDTISESNEEIVAAINYERWDNSDKNGANDLLKDPINGVVGTDTLTWTNVDGVWKISDFS